MGWMALKKHRTWQIAASQPGEITRRAFILGRCFVSVAWLCAPQFARCAHQIDACR